MEGFEGQRKKVSNVLKKTFDAIRMREQPLSFEGILEKTGSFYDKLLTATEGQFLSSPLDPTEINNTFEFKKDGLTFSVAFKPFYGCYVDPNKEKDPKRGLQTMRVIIKEPSGAISESLEVVHPQNPKRSEEASFTYERYVKVGKKYKKLTEKNTFGAWDKILQVLNKMPQPVRWIEEHTEAVDAIA